MSVTSAAVSTGLAAFGAGCNASGDPPAYTPSVHTLFFVADGRLSCAVESLTLTAIEAAITAERVKTADTPRVRLISVLLCYPMVPGRELRMRGQERHDRPSPRRGERAAGDRPRTGRRSSRGRSDLM